MQKGYQQGATQSSHEADPPNIMDDIQVAARFNRRSYNLTTLELYIVKKPSYSSFMIINPKYNKL